MFWLNYIKHVDKITERLSKGFLVLRIIIIFSTFSGKNSLLFLSILALGNGVELWGSTADSRF